LSAILKNLIMLFLTINLLLLSNAVTYRRDKSILYSRISILGLFYSSLLLYFNMDLTFIQKSISLFGGLLYCKSYTLFFTLFIFFLSSIILSLTSFYPRKIWIKDSSSLYNIFKRTTTEIYYYNIKIINKMGEQFRIIEYSLILLFIITGAVFLLSSCDLISIFLSIELQSYGLYLLSAIYRNSELSTNAGLTYFLLGGLSSCIILLGQSLLYINSGNTSLDVIYIINSIFINDIYEIYGNDASINLTNVPGIYQYYIQLSLVILSTGFLFKVSSAPFHFWSPDVYDAIPTIVTTFVAIIAKISIFIFFLELVYYASITSLNFSWKNNLLISSLLSLIIGSVLGLTQFRIKRLYAYSTISHIGFILLALSINSIESIQAFFFYILQYSISNLNAFIILITIGYSFIYLYKDTHAGFLALKEKNKDNITIYEQTLAHSQSNNENLKDTNLSPIQLISQLKGYFKINPLLAISLAITLYSFIGVPPLIGFFAKQMILSAAIDNGYIFMSLIAILTSVISAVYYLVIIKYMFFEKNEYKINNKLINLTLDFSINTSQDSDSISRIKDENKISNGWSSPTYNYNNIILSSSLTSNISIFTLIILLFIFIPNEIISISNIMSIIIFYN